jgi:hypothetical protein
MRVRSLEPRTSRSRSPVTKQSAAPSIARLTNTSSSAPRERFLVEMTTIGTIFWLYEARKAVASSASRYRRIFLRPSTRANSPSVSALARTTAFDSALSRAILGFDRGYARALTITFVSSTTRMSFFPQAFFELFWRQATCPHASAHDIHQFGQGSGLGKLGVFRLDAHADLVRGRKFALALPSNGQFTGWQGFLDNLHTLKHNAIPALTHVPSRRPAAPDRPSGWRAGSVRFRRAVPPSGRPRGR